MRRTRSLWVILSVTGWFLAIPTLLGFLAGWQIDRQSAAHQIAGRIGFALFGFLAGLFVAERTVLHRRR